MGSTPTLRTAHPEDAEKLHELHTRSVRTLCRGHYSADVIEGWLLNRAPDGFLEPIDRQAIFVAEVGNDIVGFGEAAPGAVIAVYLDPAMAGRGIGRMTLERALAMSSQDAGYVMVESTLNAAGFYRHHGFHG